MQIRLEDHSDEVYKELEAACQRALEKCGTVAEGYAKKLCPVDTGNLRNSITHMVNDGEKAAYVGTNSEYGVYVECGTGIYYPGGRQTPWTYQDENGDWHLTHGQRAKPYTKTAVADHAAQYNRIIEQELKGK
ncbi:HK97-gp10 family putative phage morphogenesis protein [Gemmiger formicilis]|uniref:HK97-gp10 family putative phage morphogenesis protein n=1 Tax=Gemmiger formicilis TaxID=745368 RepID=UPI003521196A